MSFLSSWLLIGIKDKIKPKPLAFVEQVDLATGIGLKVRGGEWKDISRSNNEINDLEMGNLVRIQ